MSDKPARDWLDDLDLPERHYIPPGPIIDDTRGISWAMGPISCLEIIRDAQPLPPSLLYAAINGGPMDGSTQRYIERRLGEITAENDRLRALLRMALDELEGNRPDGSWEETVASLKAALEPRP